MSDDRYPANFLYRYLNYQLIMTAISQFLFNRTAIDKRTDSSIPRRQKVAYNTLEVMKREGKNEDTQKNYYGQLNWRIVL